MEKYGAWALILSVGMILTACGAGEGTVGKLEGVPVEVMQDFVSAEDPAEERITEEQALEAIRAHCYAQNPELEGIVEAGEYPVYWEAVSEDDSQIIILYRTYTGVFVRYYIDPVTGDTYVTEYVPGITDEEEQTDETFNLRDEMAE